jgi:hypothetical protein
MRDDGEERERERGITSRHMCKLTSWKGVDKIDEGRKCMHFIEEMQDARGVFLEISIISIPVSLSLFLIFILKVRMVVRRWKLVAGNCGVMCLSGRERG